MADMPASGTQALHSAGLAEMSAHLISRTRSQSRDINVDGLFFKWQLKKSDILPGAETCQTTVACP